MQVDGSSGPFFVTSPTAQDRWVAGETALVEWNVAGTDGGMVACTEVDILFSADGGATFDLVLAESTPNDGVEEILAPDLTLDAARVLVACSDNIFFAVSGGFPVIDLRNRPASGRVAP